jgi:hypothetical protein
MMENKPARLFLEYAYILKPFGSNAGNLMTVKDTQILRRLRRVTAESEAIQAASLNSFVPSSIKQWQPWDAVDLMTARTVNPAEPWAKAREARRLYTARVRENWSDVRVAGAWNETGHMLASAAVTGWSIIRLHLAAALQRCHIVGVLDLARDRALLDEYCSA